jgi:hypothetical protein
MATVTTKSLVFFAGEKSATTGDSTVVDDSAVVVDIEPVLASGQDSLIILDYICRLLRNDGVV